MDGLAHFRRGLNLPAISIHWAGWSETGAAAGHEVLKRIEQSGVDSIDVKNGISALECLLAAGRVRAAVLPIDWNRFSGGADNAVGAGLFANLRSRNQTGGNASSQLQSLRSVGASNCTRPPRRVNESCLRNW